jgi:hypothetical protein
MINSFFFLQYSLFKNESLNEGSQNGLRLNKTMEECMDNEKKY